VDRIEMRPLDEPLGRLAGLTAIDRDAGVLALVGVTESQLVPFRTVAVNGNVAPGVVTRTD
jgi:hypothetical protein